MSTVQQISKLNGFIQYLKPTSIAFEDSKLQLALKVLENSDFPTTRAEAWKYTRLSKIAGIQANQDLTLSGLDHLDLKIDHDALTVIVENGVICFLHDELVDGLTIKSINEASNNKLINLGKNLKLDDEIFNALNTAFAQDGLFIHIAPNTVLNKSIQIIHVLTGEQKVANVRHMIVSEKNSQAHIIQTYFAKNADKCFCNVVSEVFVDENAHLSIDKIQMQKGNNFQVATEQVSQERNSNFCINTFTFDGLLTRNNLNIVVNGENCETHLNGATILNGDQHTDNHTVVDHVAAHCESHELYKGVIDQNATAVFNGKVFVRPNAQKINAFQSNSNVLLSESASVNSKPELEIYADDVKCSHGSTTGQLDEEAIFYLRSRGISEKSARELIIAAFLDDVIEKIEHQNVKEFVSKQIQNRFSQV